MDLPGIFSKKSSASGERTLYLALLVSAHTIQAGFWRLADEQLTLLKWSEIHTYTDLKECLVKTDEALRQLGKESEGADEVIFGFESGWVDETGVIAEHKPLLKKLTEELSLKPVGFVVITEALHHFLIADHPHLSSVVIQLFAEHMVASVVDHGEMVRSESIGISVQFESDVKEALARLVAGADDKAILPPKMLLVGTGMAADQVTHYQQLLLKQDWSATTFFVHAPTIEIMAVETAVNAVIQEGGRALALERGVKLDPEQKAQIMAVAKAEQQAAPETAVATPEPTVAIAKSFGIPIATNLGRDHNLEAVPASALSAPPAGIDEFEEAAKPAKKLSGVGWKRFMPGALFGKKSASSTETAVATSPAEEKPRSSHKLSSSRWFKNHTGFVWGGFAAGVLALVAIAVGAIIFSKTATVDLTLSSQTVSRDLALTLDPGADASDPSKLLLKARQTSKEAERSQSIETTGVTLVGDKAKGVVTIINKTDSSRTFAAGTSLSKDKMKFTLDQEVQVASSSTQVSSSGETKTYGKTEVAVTAAQIGAESNLGGGTELAVADFGSGTYSAEVKEAFTNGSSREVRVFSNEDKTKLANELKAQLVADAQSDLQSEVGEGEYVTPNGQVTVLSESTASKIGDEVRTVSMDMKVRVGALVYTKEELQPFAKELLKDSLPANYQLADVVPDILSTPATTSAKGVVILDANVSMPAFPKFDENAWKKEIAGQKTDSALAILKGKGEIEEVNVTLAPWLARIISNSVPKDFAKIIFKTKLPE